MKLSGPIYLIKKSIQIFFDRKNFIYFLEIYLILVPFVFLSSVQNLMPKTSFPFLSGISLFTAAAGLIYFIFYFWTLAAGIEAVKRVLGGGKLSFKDTFAHTWKKLWKFFLLSILLSLIILGGFILLVVPGVIFMIWFAFSGFILIDQDKGVVKSLSASKTIVKGRFWPVLGRIIVFGLFGIIVRIVLGAVPFGIGPSLTALAGGLFVLPSYLLYRELAGA